MRSKLPPLPQEYFDENRELFDAETTIAENRPPQKDSHSFYRFSATEIRCHNCPNGWTDPTGQLQKFLNI